MIPRALARCRPHAPETGRFRLLGPRGQLAPPAATRANVGDDWGNGRAGPVCESGSVVWEGPQGNPGPRQTIAPTARPYRGSLASPLLAGTSEIDSKKHPSVPFILVQCLPELLVSKCDRSRVYGNRQWHIRYNGFRERTEWCRSTQSCELLKIGDEVSFEFPRHLR